MEPQGTETTQVPTQGQREQPAQQGIARQQAAPEQANQPQYVTKAELEAAVQKFVAASQSAMGKMEARVQKKLAELQSAGIQATPEQAKQLVEADGTATLQGQQPDGNAPATGMPQPTASFDATTQQALTWMKEDGMNEPDPINLEGYKIMAEAGIRLKDGDPELNMIDPNAPPEVWKQQVKAAVQVASKRLANSGNPARMPATASGTPSGQPSHAGMSGSQTLDNYFNSLGIK